VAIVTLRYWAAAKEAAGTAEETLSAGTLAEALDVARGKAGLSGPYGQSARGGQGGPAEQDTRLRAVLARSSFLIDGTPVGSRSRDSVVLEDASVIEVLPPFAGG
jgi:molybdopterin synthase sulfur carrier subunit